jgi:putative NIF3 family GTP cyclohydrolase 1 type 2
MSFKFLKIALLALSISIVCQGQNSPQSGLNAGQIIELIKGRVTCPWSDETVDTFKSGNPKDVVEGIAVSMFADMTTLRQAVDNHCNLIIVHEPIFYNHTDDVKILLNDPVYQAKRKFIDDHKLIIWRFHDHWHKTIPDGIYAGVVDKLGWSSRKKDQSLTRFRFEKQKLSEIILQLKTVFPGEAFRVIGNPGMEVSVAALSLGAPGFSAHLKILQENGIDLLVAGEAPEWETYQYVYDAQLQGKNKAVIFLGHANSEEAGMEYCANWLKGFMPAGIPVHYIKNGSSFKSY